MKVNKLLLLAIVFVLLGTSSCEKWLDVNKDPNNPVVVGPEKVLPAAIMSGLYEIHGPYAIIGGIWSQYWTQSNAANQYKNIEAYSLAATDYNYAYNEMFSGALNDLYYVRNKSLENEDWNMYLISTVLQSYFYQVLVDLYDQVPYTEAFLGETGLLEPKWDNGADVYAALLANLDEALSKPFSSTNNRADDNVALTNTDPAQQDLLFWPGVNENTDQDDVSYLDERMDHWVSLAYFVKMKLYLRMRFVNPSESSTGIKDIIDNHDADLYIEDVGIDKYENAQNLGNPLWQENDKELNVSTNLRASTTMMSWLEDNLDPRLYEYYEQGDGGNWVSLDQGDYNRPSTEVEPTTVAVFRISPTFPTLFFSAAEQYFMLAECFSEYYTPAEAQTFYDEGVTAAFDRYGLPTEDDNGDDLIAPGGSYEFPVGGTKEEQLEAIIVQKWAALYGSHSLEAWFESNRTGYPRISAVPASNGAYIPGERTYSVNGATGGLFPKRLIFPDSEKSRNSNTPASVPLTEKVWWSK